MSLRIIGASVSFISAVAGCYGPSLLRRMMPPRKDSLCCSNRERCLGETGCLALEESFLVQLSAAFAGGVCLTVGVNAIIETVASGPENATVLGLVVTLTVILLIGLEAVSDAAREAFAKKANATEDWSHPYLYQQDFPNDYCHAAQVVSLTNPVCFPEAQTKPLLSRADSTEAHMHFHQHSNDANSVKEMVVALFLFTLFSVHSLLEGFGIGSALQLCVQRQLVFGVVCHKFLGAFALGHSLQLGRFTTRSFLVFVMIFASMTPLGILVGWQLEGRSTLSSCLTAAAGGSFIFVSLHELLFKVLEGPNTFGSRLLLMSMACLGVILIWMTES
ncbi:MAG: uncharacterized protein KVP18_003304 [Porospora cf. gigantea A]|uniref:uncharacterized protein n=1 Tax=Porospora cf. gigantea A TaxID=2853593 RepID=UPI003559DB03|nr:MAG: hypothetical protein KVP18_003304 [Porospora cf. gigantea A]